MDTVTEKEGTVRPFWEEPRYADRCRADVYDAFSNLTRLLGEDRPVINILTQSHQMVLSADNDTDEMSDIPMPNFVDALGLKNVSEAEYLLLLIGKEIVNDQRLTATQNMYRYGFLGGRWTGMMEMLMGETMPSEINAQRRFSRFFARTQRGLRSEIGRHRMNTMRSAVHDLISNALAKGREGSERDHEGLPKPRLVFGSHPNDLEARLSYWRNQINPSPSTKSP